MLFLFDQAPFGHFDQLSSTCLRVGPPDAVPFVFIMVTIDLHLPHGLEITVQDNDFCAWHVFKAHVQLICISYLPRVVAKERIPL